MISLHDELFFQILNYNLTKNSEFTILSPKNPSTLLRFCLQLGLICIAKRVQEFSRLKRVCRGPVLLRRVPRGSC